MIPENPALAHDDSMLTRRFGREVINYYAGSRLNRYSFLRADTAFLRKAAASPASQFIALENLNPLISDKTKLAFLSFEDVRPLIGAEPFHLSEEDAIKQYDSTTATPLIVFLGMLDSTSAATEFATTDHGIVNALPLFAVDVTPRPPYADAAKAFLEKVQEKGYSIQPNPRAMTLLPEAGESHFITSLSDSHLNQY